MGSTSENLLYCPPQSCEVGEDGIQSQGVPGRESPAERLEQLARPLKQKRSTVGYPQTDVGLTLGILVGKVFS